jgi:multidrug efflux pump subunit AcrA (membrane-fusion protein)
MSSAQPRPLPIDTSWRRSSWLTAAVTAAWLAVAAGCQPAASESPKAEPATEPAARSVTVVTPERKTIQRQIAQPGVIEAFERTPIVSRIQGYVLKWNVDIGDPIHTDDVLAELWVPEMVSKLKLKEEQVQQAQKALAMSQAQVATARAQVQEARAALSRAEANNNYWKSQSDRFGGLVQGGVLDKQTQEETLNQFRSAAAALSEAKARVDSVQAAQQEKESARDRAEVDIRAAEADRRYQADLVGYARLTAPYEGIVTQKNINTRQFVQPATGVQADVLYVVERTDIVRVFVSVYETDADWVKVGAPAMVRVQALHGQEFPGKVTRTAWSLNKTTRTLLTEIDLPNPEVPKLGRRLRPGMYVYATIDLVWPDVLTLPASAVVTEGDVNVGYQTYCFLVEDGKVKRTPIEIGARNDQLVEVLKKRVAAASSGEGHRYEAFTGKEQVVRGDLAGLKDGQAVNVSQKP